MHRPNRHRNRSLSCIVLGAVLSLLTLAWGEALARAEMSPQTAIGWKLFFDPQLSRTGTHACATCHNPDKGFTDGLPRGQGAYQDILPRHTPTVVNLAQSNYFFWDGRASSLEEQALTPLTNPIEMDLTPEEIVSRVAAQPEYRKVFAAIGVSKIDIDAILGAIAAFERSLETGETPFDRWLGGNEKALTPTAQRGRLIFFTRGQCATCHMGHYLTDNNFHNIGTGTHQDPGRFKVTGEEQDKGLFKTPSLRNWKGTEPFMHDGSLATLRDILEFYSRPLPSKVGVSELDALALEEEEKEDLLAFLETLNGPWPDLSVHARTWQNLLESGENTPDNTAFKR
jgi:Cytochrome c peroxidase